MPAPGNVFPMNEMNLRIPRQAATLRLLVEDRIREAIASGHFRPGQRLVERELCEQIGVGRTSVREALRQLEAEGLVVTVPRSISTRPASSMTSGRCWKASPGALSPNRAARMPSPS